MFYTALLHTLASALQLNGYNDKIDNPSKDRCLKLLLHKYESLRRAATAEPAYLDANRGLLQKPVEGLSASLLSGLYIVPLYKGAIDCPKHLARSSPSTGLIYL